MQNVSLQFGMTLLREINNNYVSCVVIYDMVILYFQLCKTHIPILKINKASSVVCWKDESVNPQCICQISHAFTILVALFLK